MCGSTMLLNPLGLIGCGVVLHCAREDVHDLHHARMNHSLYEWWTAGNPFDPTTNDRPGWHRLRVGS